MATVTEERSLLNRLIRAFDACERQWTRPMKEPAAIEAAEGELNGAIEDARDMLRLPAEQPETVVKLVDAASKLKARLADKGPPAEMQKLESALEPFAPAPPPQFSAEPVRATSLGNEE